MRHHSTTDKRIRSKPSSRVFTTGFTLIETLVALGIGVSVATMLTLVASAGLKHARSARRVERLQTNAVHLSDVLTYWVKQGEYLQVPTPTRLEIILPDFTVKTIEKQGIRATLDGVAITTDDAEVSYILFQNLPASVRVGFALQAAGSTETFSATTTVAKRNQP